MSGSLAQQPWLDGNACRPPDLGQPRRLGHRQRRLLDARGMPGPHRAILQTVGSSLLFGAGAWRVTAQISPGDGWGGVHEAPWNMRCGMRGRAATPSTGGEPSGGEASGDSAVDPPGHVGTCGSRGTGSLRPFQSRFGPCFEDAAAGRADWAARAALWLDWRTAKLGT